jgi:surface antigen
LLNATAPAAADNRHRHDWYDDDDQGHDRGHKDHKDKRRTVIIHEAPVIVHERPVIVHRAPVVFVQGPPPWAPAHGYRRHGREVVYVAPYGINAGHCYREQIGQVLCGVGGAVIGSQIGQGSGRVVAAVGGALIGVLVGGTVGRSLDRVDYACAGQILEYAPNNRTIVWNNPQTGGSYQMTPTAAYQVDGRYCREYTSTATIAGQRQQVYGTACRQPDGAWQIVSQ